MCANKKRSHNWWRYGIRFLNYYTSDIHPVGLLLSQTPLCHILPLNLPPSLRFIWSYYLDAHTNTHPHYHVLMHSIRLYLKLISFEYITGVPMACVSWCIKSMSYVADIILLHSMNFGIVICLEIIYIECTNVHTGWKWV